MADNSKKTLAILIPIILIIALIAYLVIQQNDDSATPATQNDATTQTTDTEETEESMLSRITDDPEPYYGQQVSVEGEIQDVYSQRVFKVSDQAIGDELLVVAPRALTAQQLEEAEPLFEDNANVTVAGTLRQIVIADIEREFSIDVPGAIEAEFENKPVLVADTFTFRDTNAVFDFTDDNSGAGDNTGQ